MDDKRKKQHETPETRPSSRNMHSETSDLSCKKAQDMDKNADLEIAAATPIPTSTEFHYDNKRSDSPCLFSRVHGGLKLLADAASFDARFDALVQAAETNNITTFSDECEAMRFCLRTPSDNTFRVGIRKRNTEDAILFDVYSTLPNRNFERNHFPKHFDLIKAYAPSIVARHSSKNPYLLVDMQTPGIEHVIHKQGPIRETYHLPDKKKLKLYHHTCTYVDQSPCVNCQNPDDHKRCLAGEHFYAIMDR